LSSVIQAIDPELKAAARTYGIKPSLVNLIVLFPVVLVVMYVFFVLFPPTRSVALYLVWGENSLVEDLTFILLLSGAVLGLRLAWRTKKLRGAVLASAFFVLFSIGMLWTAGEEASWGQWIVGFEALPTPSWMYEVNSQHEITLHNIGAPPGEGRNENVPLLPRGFGVGGLLGVFLGVWVYSRKRFWKVATPVILLPWFLVITIFSGPWVEWWLSSPWTYSWMSWYLPYPNLWPLAQVTEMMVGITGSLFVWLNARKVRATPPANGFGQQ
jgi:hypothetical protein